MKVITNTSPSMVLKCFRCGKEDDSVIESTCPYKEDIGGDYETLCVCCYDCRSECVMEI